MKEINLKEAYNYLMLCRGVLYEEKILNISLLNLNGEYNNEFAYLTLMEQSDSDDSTIVEIIFKEGDNQTVLIKDSSLIMVDTNGNEIPLNLLKEWNVEV